MSLRRFLAKILNAEGDQRIENDRTPPSPSTSNVTTAHSHSIPGRDSQAVRQPEYSPTDTMAPSQTLSGRGSVWQPESPFTDTIGTAENIKVATPDYSKRPSVSSLPILICVTFVSILSDLR